MDALLVVTDKIITKNTRRRIGFETRGIGDNSHSIART